MRFCLSLPAANSTRAGAGLIVVSSLAAQILGTESQKKEVPAPKQR